MGSTISNIKETYYNIHRGDMVIYIYLNNNKVKEYIIALDTSHIFKNMSYLDENFTYKDILDKTNVLKAAVKNIHKNVVFPTNSLFIGPFTGQQDVTITINNNTMFPITFKKNDFLLSAVTLTYDEEIFNLLPANSV
ncbi:hypothetical protein [Heterosigma akashiwo virus 01]|jgi:hypothetical protein|uniref:Uncharacterized protein n=1 Tax=Heterosigma akashiwo virus 01 TaxID=97195 RepID=A0A1C9C5A2_HAV01|nr:hypothetical protein D1R72_gp138 [Heterosigma akashiwo virus 01]AOM63469.1 hypothetical protein [Heterosigma akashiwo virus 01]